MAGIMVMLKCITNMHVGNGDVNYNIIDNEVEKDPITGYPCINASGVKGALREYIEKDCNNVGLSNRIFGKPGEDNTQGTIKVLGAEMLSMPMRASRGSDESRPYFMCTTKTAVERFNSLFEQLVENKNINPLKKSGVVVGDSTDEAEGISLKGADKYSYEDKTDEEKTNENKVKNCITIYCPKDDKGDIFNKSSLPVMARNCLDEDRKNLWYEEVVPHESIFYFPVLGGEDDIRELSACINGKIVQFGGNASIGYGLCKVSIY